MSASGQHFEQAEIDVGGTTRVVTGSDLLTPAELVALNQVLATGHQSILLGTQGQAVGGHFDVGMLGQINSLVIPQGVTAIQDFAQLSGLNLSGNFANSGNFYAVSTNSQVTSAVLSAANIFNNQGGLLTSVLPAAGLPGIQGAIGSLNLTLNALNDIVNAGIISSSGNLNLTAGGSIVNALPAGVTGPSPALLAMNNLNLTSGLGNIVNSGVMSAMANINIASQVARDIIVNNIGGRMESILGSINVRDELFGDKKHLVFWGGDVIAKELNLYSGTGIVNMNVNDLSGVLNIYGGEAHVTAATDRLQLGTISLTGDPTFYNTGGDVVINQSLSFSGENLAVIASRDILTDTGAGGISTSISADDAGNILLVAGANFTSTGDPSVLPPDPGDTTSTLVISGGSFTGGKIDLTLGDPITAIDASVSSGTGSGGNVTLIAFQGNDQGSGTITLPTGVTILTGGSETGSNGDVNIIAGAESGTSITLGGINTTGGSGGGGAVNVSTATPEVFGESVPESCDPCVVVKDGAIQSGSFITGASQNGSIDLGNVIAGDVIAIGAGNLLTAASLSTENDASIDLQANDLNISGSVDAGAGTVTIRTAKTERAITIGGVNAGELNITNDLLSQITAGTVVIGDLTTTGGISLASSVDVSGTGAGAFNLELYNAGNFIANGNGITLGTHDLTIDVGGTLNAGPIDGGNLTLTAGGSLMTAANVNAQGNITFSSGGQMETFGTLTAGGDVSLETTGVSSDILIGGNVVADGSVTANATGSILAPSKTQGTISSSGDPWQFLLGATLSKDGTRLYVPDFFLDIVAIIDTSTNTQVGTISGFSEPQGTAISGDGSKLYVANFQSQTVSVVDLTTPNSGTIVGTVAINGGVESVALSKDGTKLYVLSDINSNPGVAGQAIFSVVDVSNPSAPTVLSTLNLGTNRAQTGGIVLNATGTLAYVSNSGTRNVFVIDLASNSIQTTIDLSSIGGANPQSPMFLAIDPNGTRVYVAEAFRNSSIGFTSGSVSIIDANPASSTFNTLLTNVPLGQGGDGAGGRFPQGIAVSPTNVEVFAQITYDSFMSVVNTASLLPGSISTGQGPDGFGSSAFSGIVMRNGVPTLVTYTSNTINLTGPNTISVVEKPTIQSNNISLIAGGNIDVNYDAMGGMISANASNGSVFLGQVGSAASSVGASSANSGTGVFQVGSLGSLTTAGTILGRTIVLEATANNGSVTIGSQVGDLATDSVRVAANGSGSISNTAAIRGTNVSLTSNSGNIFINDQIIGSATIGTGTGNVVLDADVGGAGVTVRIRSGGSGNISQTAGTITGQNVVLASTTGDIGGPSENIEVSSAGLSANTAGDVYIHTLTAVNVSASSAGDHFKLVGDGSITTSGVVQADSLEIESTGIGAIQLGASIGRTGSGTSTTITATGAGSIFQTSGTILGSTVTLTADSGNIGANGQFVNVTTGDFTANSTTGSVFLSHTGPLTYNGGSGAGATFHLLNTGQLTVDAGISAGQLILQTAGNGSIILLTGVGSASGTTTIMAGGSGNITQTSTAGVIQGTSVVLTNGTGIIGSPVNNIRTDAGTLAVTTNGSAYVTDSGAVTLNSSSAGNTLRITTGGLLSVSGNISAPNLTLQSLSSSPGISLGGNVGLATGNTTIIASGAGNITWTSGSVTGATVTIASGSGSLGTLANPIRTATANLNANTGPGGSVFLDSTTALTLRSGSAGSQFHLRAAGNITTASGVVAPDVRLETTANGNLIMNSNLGRVGVGTIVTIILGGSGVLQQSSTANFISSNINLSTTTSNLGTASAPIRLPSSTVSVTTGGSGSAFLTSTGILSLGASSVGDTLRVTAAGINVVGNVNSNTTLLQTTTNGSITIGANLGSIAGTTTLTTNGAGNIVSAGGTVFGSTLTLTTGGGSIGADGNSLFIFTNSVTAKTVGKVAGSEVFLRNTGGAVTLGASSTSGTFQLESTGAITVSGNIVAPTVTIRTIAPGGAIVVSASVGGKTGTTTLSTAGGGSISTTGAGKILSPGVVLSSDTGSIGTAGARLLLAATSLSVSTGGATGSAFITNNGKGTLMLGPSSAGTSGTLDIQTTGNIGQSSGVLSAGTVVLTAASKGILGTATANLQTSASTLRLTGGTIFVNNQTAVSLGASSAGTALQLTAPGITVTGEVLGPNVTLKALGGGNILVGANVGNTNGITTLETNSGGSILRTAGAVRGSIVNLTAGTGAIGQAGVRLLTQAAIIRASANTSSGSQIFIDNTGPVAIESSAAGSIFDLQSSGTITLRTALTAGTITLRTTAASNGSIALLANVGQASGSVSLIAGGSGTISQGLASNFLGSVLVLTSTSGTMGSATAPIRVSGGSVAVSTGAGGSVFLTSTGALNVSNSTVGGALQVTADGTITTIGNISAGNLLLRSIGNNPGIIINSNVGSAAGVTTLQADGSGNITRNSGTVLGNSVTLLTGTGNIGSLGSPIQTTASNLRASTAGAASNVFLSNTSGVVLAASNAGATFQLISSGGITVNGNLQATNLTLQTTGSQSISLGNALIKADGGALTVTAGVNGSISQAAQGVLLGNTIALASTGGDIGTAGLNIKTITSQLTVSTAGLGSAFVTNATTGGPLALGTSSGGATFQLTNVGTINLAGTVTGGAVSLLVSSGSGGSISLGANNITATGAVTLRADGAGSISGTGTISGTSANFTSGTGNIGTLANPLNTQVTSITANTGGTGSVFINQTGNVTVSNSGGGNGFQVTATGSVTASNIATFSGALTLVSGSGVLSVSAGSGLSATGGDLTLQSTDTVNGSIQIGANATLSASKLGTSSGDVKIFIGASPTPVAGTEPGNVVVESTAPGDVFFGTDGITANAPDNFLTANGQDIIFDAGGLGAGAITLGGGVGITASSVPLLTSLDLTNPDIVAFINGTLGGSLTVGTGGVAIGGSALIMPSNLAGRLTAMNIPANVTIQLGDFAANNQIRIVLNDTSSTKSATVAGTLAYQASSSAGNISILTNQSVPALSVTATGSLTITTGDLSIAANGNISIAGNVSAPNLSIATNGGTNGSIVLGTSIGSASGTTTLSTDGSGGIQQVAGTVLGTTVSLSSQHGDIGSVNKSIFTSANLITANSSEQGSVFIQNNVGSNVTTVGASTSGQNFVLRATGAIVTTGSIDAGFGNTVGLVAGVSGGNHSITLGGDVKAGITVVLNASGSGAVEQNMGTVFGNIVQLFSGSGNIGANATPLHTNAAVLTASTTGDVFIQKDFSAAVSLGASSAGNVFRLVSSGNISVTGAVVAKEVTLQTSGAQSIQLGANVGRTGSGTVTTIASLGAGNITRTAGLLFGEQITLTSNGGSIGTSNSNLINTATGSLTASTSGSGSVFVLNTGNVTVGASQAGQTFLLGSTGNITAAGNITAGLDIGLIAGAIAGAKSGAVNVQGDLSAGGTVNLAAAGSSAITVAAGKTVSGNSVLLASGTGNIGTTNSPLQISAASLTANTAGSVALVETSSGGLTLGASNGTKGFLLESLGSITVTGAVTGSAITLRSTGGDGGITIGANIGNTGKTGSVVVLEANGSGDISQTQPAAQISGTSVVLSSGTGSIGTLAAPVRTAVATLTATTGGTGNVFLRSASAVNVNASSAGNTFSLSAAGTISIKGTVAGDQLSLLTENNSNGAIILGASIGRAGAAVTLSASGLGSITQTSGNFIVDGQSLVVSSGTGSIGTATVNLRTSAQDISANSGGSSNIFLTATGGVSLDASAAGSTFQLSAAGPVTTNGVVQGNTLVLQTSSGNVTLGGDVGRTNGVTVVRTGGAGGITQLAGSVLGVSVTLESGTGDIGSIGSAVQVTAPSLSVKTAAGGSAFVEGSSALSLGASTVGNRLEATANGQLSVVGALSAGNVVLQTVGSGNILLGANVSAGGGSIVIVADGDGNIVQTAGLLQAASADLSSSFGSIGSAALTVKTAVSNLSVRTADQAGMLGGVFVTNSGTLTLTNSGAGSAFVLSNVGSLTVGSVSVGNGSLTLVSSGPALNVQTGATLSVLGGDILIQNTNAASGTIVIGQNATVQALSGFPGQGNVTIAVGLVPTVPIVGPTPANVTPTQVNGGQIFYGANGIVALAPNNSLTADGARLIFSTGTRPANAITLGGGVTIIADPPVPTDAYLPGSGTTPLVDTGASASGLPLIGEPVGVLAPSLLGALSSSPQAQIGGSVLPVATDQVGMRHSGLAEGFSYWRQDFEQVIDEAAVLGADETSVVEEQTRRPLREDRESGSPVESETPGAAVVEGPLQPIAFAPSAAAATASMSRVVAGKVGNLDVRHSGSAGISRHGSGELELSAGETVVAATRAEKIRCGRTELHLGRGTIALIQRDGDTVKVANLCENGSGSVKVIVHGRSVSVSAGQEVIVSSEASQASRLMQRDGAGRRKVRAVEVDDRTTITRSEVSITSLLTSNPVLRSLVGSQHDGDRQLATRLMKMAACLMVVTGQHGAYTRSKS